MRTKRNEEERERGSEGRSQSSHHNLIRSTFEVSHKSEFKSRSAEPGPTVTFTAAGVIIHFSGLCRGAHKLCKSSTLNSVQVITAALPNFAETVKKMTATLTVLGQAWRHHAVFPATLGIRMKFDFESREGGAQVQLGRERERGD